MKVLIVEDNPDHRFLLRKRLESHYRDIAIHTASTVGEAVERLESYVYEAILLDYRLRGPSGNELVKWMHKKGIDTPVIMITSVEDVEIAVQAIKLGVYDYLTKSCESIDKLPFILDRVSEEYHLKQKLRETEFKYQTLVDGIGEAVFQMNSTGDIIYISPSVEKLLKYSEDEFRKNFSGYFLKDGWKSFQEKFTDVLEGKPVDPFVVELKKKDGETVIVEINASQYAEGGEVRGVIGTLQDVTKRVRLEREIESERQKVIDMFNNTIDLIYIVDGDYNINFINSSLQKEIGEPITKKCFSHLYSRKKPCGFCKWPSIREGHTVRWELRRRDGKTFDIISSPLKNPDRSISKMEILRDITMRKEAEENFRKQSEETRKANEELKITIEQLRHTQEQLVQSEKLAAIGQLVAGVAHELNNPLFSAMGNTELLIMDSKSAKVLEKLQNILESINRARLIVEDLMQFARREKIEKEYLSINKVIKKAISLREYELRVNNIDLECELQNNVPLVLGNCVRLEQVILNIIINAEQAIGGTRTIGLIKIHSMVDERQSKIHVVISNNGPEIPRDIRANIFDPFFTTKDVGRGTGLGLSTSYGIIKDHGGDIWVQSDSDWTTFTVELPTVMPESAKVPKIPERKIKGDEELQSRVESVLIVDDEPVIVKLLLEFFSRKGFTVVTAASGAEAILKLDEKDVDLIITDIKMPGMDGKDFYEKIKCSRPELIERLLFITGDTVNDETRSFLKETRANCLKKPFSFNEMTEVINSLRKQRV